MNKKHNDKDFIRESRAKHYHRNTYTYGDYKSWTDEKRYELIDGVIYDMAPAPGRRQQRISIELGRQFSTYLLDRRCEVYLAPFDVRLAEGDETDEEISTVVQPDLLVVCDSSKLDEKGVKGTPDLVTEIISPGSAKKDREIKRDLYEMHGVNEYWIVDYHEDIVEVYLLNEKDQYDEPVIYTKEDMIPVNIFSDFKVDLKMVFRD